MAAMRRMSADQRRELVIKAAVTEFSRRGLEGTSTEAIAKRAGISQPYLFRLFPNKLALFIAAAERGIQKIADAFESAAQGLAGEDALIAMGAAYVELLKDRELLMMQLHTHAACHDSEVRASARQCWQNLVALVHRLSGADMESISMFMAKGMLCNTMAAMEYEDVDPDWLSRVIHVESVA